jgi:uncharacterized membrane protein HdeD (DUF308 family)
MLKILHNPTLGDETIIDKESLRIFSYLFLVLGIVLLVGGLIFLIYPVDSRVPDNPSMHGIIYPYSPYSAGLFTVGFVLLFIGLVLIFILRRSKNDAQLIRIPDAPSIRGVVKTKRTKIPLEGL